MATTLPTERIERSILLIRGHKVLLDVDLAALYGVPTKRLNEQVRRNRARFPEDFMFQLTAEEATSLRSQFATSNKGRGGRRYAPYAFTEQGVAMLSTVLNSERAILVNIEIMRAFVRLFLNPVNDLNGAQRLNDWNDWNGLRYYKGRVGEEVRRTVQGRVRRYPPTHDATGAEEKENRISGGRKSRRLRTAVVAAHFDLSRIPETWKYPSLVVFRI